MTTLAEINRNLQDQNDVLKDAADSMVSVKEALERLIKQDESQFNEEQNDENRREEKANKQRIEDKREAREKARKDRPESFRAGFMQGVNPLAGSSAAIAGAAGGFAESIMSGLFQGRLGALSLGAVMGSLGGLVGRGLVFGGLAALVGKFGDDIISNLFENIAPGLSEDDNRRLASGIGDAAKDGLLVSIFSPTAGLGVFAGGALGVAMNSFLSDETRQEEFGTVLGQSISNEEAINRAMQAAGLAAMYGGPMAGLVVAIAGTGVVAMSRIQDFIENKRDEQLQILNDELEQRAVDGQALLETSWLDNLANRLGLNIQSAETQSTQAVLAEGLGIFEQIRRQQEAAVAPTLDYYGPGADPMSGQVLNSAALDRSQLSEERQAELARFETAFNSFIGNALMEGGQGATRRAKLREATDTSLRNAISWAELLGRDVEKEYLESIIADREAGRRETVRSLGRGVLDALGLSSSSIDTTGPALEIAGAVATPSNTVVNASPEAVPTSGLRLEDIQANAITLPTVATIDPAQLQVLIEAVASGRNSGGGGSGTNLTLLPVPMPTDRWDTGI